MREIKVKLMKKKNTFVMMFRMKLFVMLAEKLFLKEL